MNEFSDREFVAGSLTGLRSFNVDALGRLTAVTNSAIWRPGVNDAECKRGAYTSMWHTFMRIPTFGASFSVASEPEQAPATPPVSLVKKPKHRVGQMGCTCGFYAYHDTDDNPYRERDDTVVGLVEGWGSVTVGSRGFRASKARVVALVDPGPRRVSVPSWLTPLRAQWATWLVLAGAAFTYQALAGHDWLYWVLVGISCVLPVAMLFAVTHLRDKRRDAGPMPARVYDNYPDVPVYRTLAAALAAHPLTPPPPPIDPTPETDPEFWTRAASR